MTEINDNTEPLPPSVTRFVLHWGDLGSQWGVNRSVAQIHALLYLSEQPLPAEVIADRLGLARSNVSNSIKELLNWGLIHRVPVLGDRRDHYAAETDIWEMVTRIAKGRKAREIDPAEILPQKDRGADKALAIAGRLATVESEVEKLKGRLLASYSDAVADVLEHVADAAGGEHGDGDRHADRHQHQHDPEDQQSEGQGCHSYSVTLVSNPRAAWAKPISAVSASGGTMAA